MAEPVPTQPAQPSIAAEARSPAIEWPALIGIVEARDGTRTAVLLTTTGDTMFALVGDLVDGGYRVRHIDAASIELLRVDTGDARVSRLK